MTWAIPQDITDRWVGAGVPTDTDLMTALIADAEAVILAEYPAIQARIDATTLPLSTVKMVVVRMVSRIMRNPEGLSYWQQNTGPFGQGKNYGQGNADIWMSAEEVKLLAPKRKGKAFEVDLAPFAIPGMTVSGNLISEYGVFNGFYFDTEEE